jgi:hypothetical protein
MSVRAFRAVFVFTFGLMLMAALSGNVQAQLAKRGTYSGVFGWDSRGETVAMPDEGNSYWMGQFNGAFFNDSGSGFIHRSSVICPSSGSVLETGNFYGGQCIVTDKEGDKLVLTWECSFNAEGKCIGKFDWVHGTGKYTGISGRNSFTGTAVHKGPQGYATWKGEWRLP